jgi:hypothetical protein
MSKVRALVGINGQPLPVLPPDRDPRVWARLVRVMFYTPGFMAILLIKTGEPAGFGISVELLMLASASAIVAGLFIGTQSAAGGATSASRVGTWSGALVLELLAAVPFLCALPSLFHELATSNLLHAAAPTAIDTSLGASELLPIVAIVPFVVYQLGGFGTLHYVLTKAVNWAVNIAIVVLIITSYIANRAGDFPMERKLVGVLVLIMAATTVYGIIKLRTLQTAFDLNAPPEEKKKKDKKDKKDKDGDDGEEKHKHKHKHDDEDTKPM